jgi:hypothetical protein|tara:strand:+ start:495 stop:647 length:153 start_codon:yes stop_codon:yes gene_type:complete
VVFIVPGCTPKEAHSRIFVTGGSLFDRQMTVAKKKASWGGKLEEKIRKLM